MSEPAHVSLAGLQVGDELSQDIMAGSQVLLRSGTILSEGHIRRLRQLPLGQVAVRRELAAQGAGGQREAEVLARPLPDFNELRSGDRPGWLADEYFSQPVPVPQSLSRAERLLSEAKHELCRSIGLEPLVDPERDAWIKQEVHAAYISSMLKQEVNLDQLGAAAGALASAIRQNPRGYLDFADIDQYGQYLAARAIMSCKAFHHALSDSTGIELDDHVRGQLALCNAFALMPAGLADTDIANAAERREQFGSALLSYYGWLRSQHFVNERTLELVLLQHEHYDGTGSPYGLHGEMLPVESEAWAVATAFASRLYSLPRRPRQSSREAADHIFSLSGKTHSSQAVNRFLNSLGYYPNGSLVELNNDELALVVSQNSTALLKPVVRLVQLDGQIGEQLDLRQAPAVFIRRQVMEY